MEMAMEDMKPTVPFGMFYILVQLTLFITSYLDWQMVLYGDYEFSKN